MMEASYPLLVMSGGGELVEVVIVVAQGVG